MKKKRNKPPFHPMRRSYYIPELDGTAKRVPRREEMFYPSSFDADWEDSDPPFEWLATCRRLAQRHGCVLILDVRHHWKESWYAEDWCIDYKKRIEGPTLLVGGAGDPNCVCSALLHELGHHILKSKKRHPSAEMDGEEEAWKIAQDLAREHNLPLVARARRLGLSSHRLYFRDHENRGSKKKAGRRPIPGSWALGQSKRAAQVPVPKDSKPLGKKGRRLTKKILKRLTHKAERRRKEFMD